MPGPKLSVLLPNYNPAPYLPRCVEAILGQSFGGEGRRRRQGFAFPSAQVQLTQGPAGAIATNRDAAQPMPFNLAGNLGPVVVKAGFRHAKPFGIVFDQAHQNPGKEGSAQQHSGKSPALKMGSIGHPKHQRECEIVFRPASLFSVFKNFCRHNA